ncbi:MAG TPA: putative lipid II flippase FtsW [Burkholderiales bacterium]|nr:putative lipid II flippase FtsW [Burkholderiales bacterium]
MDNAMFYSDVKRRPPLADYDRTLLWICIILMAIGLVMVYSASIAIAGASRSTGHEAAYYLVRQALFLALGIGIGAVVFQVPMALWQRTAPYLFILGVMLTILVLVPGIGHEVNGSQRWISLRFFNLQPSEPLKLLAVLYAADYTIRKALYMNNLRKGFLPMLGVMLLVGGLLLQEPDFGAFAVIACIAMGILFLGGMNWRLFVGLLVMLVIGFLLLIWTSPYRMERVVGFMNPWADPFGKGYQLSHALIAFGRGEWFGVGLGASVEKLFYLPEAYTDFLLAVIAEELGFVGVLVVVSLFGWLVIRAFAIGRQAASVERYFPALVAQGIGLWLAVQAIINMGVNMGLLPTKGLTLPLLSFGGSGIVTNCAAVAMLLRVDWENRQLMKGFRI